MFNIQISVIIPTYNPNADYLQRVLNALRSQTFEIEKWELIIVDNNSNNNVLSQIDVSWHPHFKIIVEKTQGLTYSRLCGFEDATGSIVVLVDDDNVLAADYLSETARIFANDLSLGAAGGKSIPDFESMPPKWLKEFHSSLALKDLGNTPIFANWQNEYPVCAPIGAGMALRKVALNEYIDQTRNARYVITDRSKLNLSSGGDNEIVLKVLKAGWRVGYFPQLSLHHLIPEQRFKVAYLAKLLNNTNKSWVQVLENNGINPWKKIRKQTLLLRKAKAWFSYAAWRNDSNYIKWQGACGFFDGLASLNKHAI